MGLFPLSPSPSESAQKISSKLKAAAADGGPTSTRSRPAGALLGPLLGATVGVAEAPPRKRERLSEREFVPGPWSTVVLYCKVSYSQWRCLSAEWAPDLGPFSRRSPWARATPRPRTTSASRWLMVKLFSECRWCVGVRASYCALSKVADAPADPVFYRTCAG
jgi:hypothetical protein